MIQKNRFLADLLDTPCRAASTRVAVGLGVSLIMFCLYLLLPLTASHAQEPLDDVGFQSGDEMVTTSVAWGDYDGDGDLDLAVGNGDLDQNGEPEANQIYRNDGAGHFMSFQPVGDTKTTTSVAWGDYDGDGDLDLAVGNRNEVNQIYRNDGGYEWFLIDLGTISRDTRSVAWGDYDGDGDLDLAVGNNGQANQIYENKGNNLFEPFDLDPSHDLRGTYSVAWGDSDRDGDLDLAVGNYDQANQIYRNDGTGQFVPFEPVNDTKDTRGVAWGDYDMDGDLDLAVGNNGQVNQIYRNSGENVFDSFDLGSDAKNTSSVAWGDYDGDGDLDLAVGNRGSVSCLFCQLTDQVSQIYRNDGTTNFDTFDLSSDSEVTYSVAWGDYDGDGDLDLALGNYGYADCVEADDAGELCTFHPHVNMVLRNASGVSFSPFDLNDSPKNTRSVAWGDYDADGDLDLAVGNQDEANQIYRNEGRDIFVPLDPVGPNVKTTYSVAWGDYDGDDDLDLAIGNVDQVNQIYRNDRENGWSLIELGTFTRTTRSVAWGDYDSDGDLDLAVGNNGQANQIYENKGNDLFEPFDLDPSHDLRGTYSVAWGDSDRDGDLDLAVGNYDQANQIYRNDGAGHFVPFEPVNDTKFTRSVAWGDYDHDGRLDLAVGNYDQANQIYHNQENGSFALSDDRIGLAEKTYTMAWVDYDGDSELDLAIGNAAILDASGQHYQIYRYEQGSGFSLAWESTATADTRSMAWGDYDSDGDVDFVVGNHDSGQANQIYKNTRQGGAGLPNNAPFISTLRPYTGTTGTASFYAQSKILSDETIPITYALFDPEGDPVGRIEAFYSPNGGGEWFPATTMIVTETTNLTTGPYPTATLTNTHIYHWNTLASGFFGQTDNMVFRLVAYPQSNTPSISVTFHYTNITPGPIQRPYVSVTTFPFRVWGTRVRVFSETIADMNTVASALVYRLPAGQTTGGFVLGISKTQPFTTNTDGFLEGRGEIGLNDTLVALLPITLTDAYAVYHTNIAPTLTELDAFTVATPGVQELAVSAQNPLMLFNLVVSLEWDARKDTTYLSQLEDDIQRASELLYDASNGQTALGQVTVYYAGEKWEEADLRIHATNRLRPHALIGGSVDELTGVSLANPEVQLAFAPGHIEMPASWNRFGESSGSLGEDWPRALAHEFGHYYFFLLEDYLGMDEAGRPVAVTTCPSLMGNVYLDENSEFHPALSWTDSATYNCLNTLQHQTLKRSDWEAITAFYPWLHAPDQPYLDQNPGPSTLPIAVTQIRHIYPSAAPTTLDVPAYYLTKPDGSRYSASSSARAFRFHGGNLSDLGEPRQDRLQAWGAGVDNERVCVYDMNPLAPAVGCLPVQTGLSLLPMQPQTDWLPDIILSPVSTNTLTLSVSNVGASAALRAQIYDASRPLTTSLPATLALQYNPQTRVFSATLPVYLEAYLRLWDANNPGRELVTDFTLSGAPALDLAAETTLSLGIGASYTDENGATHPIDEGTALQIGNGTALQIGNGTALLIGNGTALLIGNGTALQIGNGTTFVLGSGAALQIGNGTALQIGNGTALLIGNGTALLIGNGTALQIGNGTALQIGNGTAQLLADGNGPVLSSDGQVILYVDSLDFAPGQFYTLQPATRVANPPTWATVVGQPYRLSASPGAPAIAGSSLSFRYLGRDVPPGEENFLKVFYFDETTEKWLPLDTTLDTVQNSAAALAQGPGLYVLMSTIPVALRDPGWNLFAWPVQGSRAVTEALASIADNYTAIYGYDGGSAALPWQLYSPDSTVPDALKNLHELVFGKGYWITVTQPITLYLKGNGGEIRLADPRQLVGTPPSPPATLFGPLSGPYSANVGLALQAWIGGHLCGTGESWLQDGIPVYGVHVAGSSQIAGCGEVGRTVELRMGEAVADPSWQWTTSGLHRLPLILTTIRSLFLPSVSNERPFLTIIRSLFLPSVSNEKP